MSIADTIVAEFDHETTTTRKFLERTPAAAAGWKPHEKSMTLGQLAAHLANLPSWGGSMLLLPELDIAPVGQPPLKGPDFQSTEALLATFDRNVAEARTILAGMSDEEYGRPWTLLAGGQQVFTIPRLAVARTYVLNHLIHHRGQYSVYLRLQDVPVPGSYGPSADETGM
ncbi:MAG: hypothetical protein ABS52_09030 [Gemmatimonadetes bacterium SCN 70-22]|jgi:uncharacterized damage-inducible protein DinB|nr:MAG: hypothetical protein ABS52_09030 [Gemmatimonadetes bacterium SCN 70-22]